MRDLVFTVIRTYKRNCSEKYRLYVRTRIQTHTHVIYITFITKRLKKKTQKLTKFPSVFCRLT